MITNTNRKTDIILKIIIMNFLSTIKSTLVTLVLATLALSTMALTPLALIILALTAKRSLFR